MIFTKEEILGSYGPGDAARFLVAADHFLLREDKELAASALDRAYALSPDDTSIARQRASILDELAIVEHGLVFRYVPAGTFLMGSEHGDPDERPVHPRSLDAYWIMDAPIGWEAFCRLVGFEPPPAGAPRDADTHRGALFFLNERNKIRWQYCEDATEAAHGWHAHAKEHATTPPTYARKPMIAVSPSDAEELARTLTVLGAGRVEYALPAESEWEKAARGGRAQAPYSWGDARPTAAVCDFDHMGDYQLRDPRRLPPNGYGLYGVCGGVWEWTADRYDALSYHHASRGDLSAPPAPTENPAYVLRGGSFTDCAEAVTVSFRSSRADAGWRTGERLSGGTPNVGFRLVRRRIAKPEASSE